MAVAKTFLLNMSVLVTCTYLFNLAFKYLFDKASQRAQQTALIVIFILSGWLSMMFAVKGQGYTLFDLRALPIVFGTILFRQSFPLLIIGAGIAVGRFVITGFVPQAMTGALNVMLLGCVGALLVQYYQAKRISYRKKAILSVFTIITAQVIGIASFGAIPSHYYLYEIAPYTYPMGLLVSLFFVLIIHEFYKEQLQGDKLRTMNQLLRRQTRELRQIKNELEVKAGQLLTASRYKSEFIANMTHELKTPLNSIILLSQFIKENEESVYQQEDVNYAGIIQASGKDLLSIINDILDLSKVEAGKLELNYEWATLEDLFELIRCEFQPMVQQKGLQFDIAAAPGVCNVFRTDVLRVRQILRNLLMNAVKFTDAGRVELEVTSTPSTMIFTVMDTGMGISPDKQDIIFEAFQQEDGAFTRKYGGTGLGLSISLQLAKLLGGLLTVESRKGEGSRFTLEIPVTFPSSPDLPSDSLPLQVQNAVPAIRVLS